MRSIFLFGGFFGFTVVLFGGWLAGRPMDLVLRDAAIGCLAMALLFRWFWNLVVKSFHETAMTRKALALKAELEAEEAEATNAPTKNRPVSSRPTSPVAGASARAVSSVSASTAAPSTR